MKKSVLLVLCICGVFNAASCNKPVPEMPELSSPGGTYTKVLTLTILNLKENEKAFYSLDGSEPSESSIPYSSSGISLPKGESQLKIIKVSDGGNYSEILTANFSISTKPDIPVLATPDGIYNREYSAVIIYMEAGEKAYYTLDGTSPNQDSACYTDEGIPLLKGEHRIKIIKYDGPDNYSDVLTANLTIKPYEPDYSNLFTKLVRQDDYIYYVETIFGEYSEFTGIPYSRLSRYNIADGSRKVILNRNADRILIRNGKIYYEETVFPEEDEVSRLLACVDLDGKNQRQLIKCSEEDFQFTNIMIDDWIYYLYRNTSEGESYYHIYRINAKTLETEQVSESAVSAAVLAGRGIIYAGWEQNIYHYNADTAETTQVSADAAGRLKVFGSFLFYQNDTGTYRIRPDGTDYMKVPIGENEPFIVVGDRIIYAEQLTSIRFDGADSQLLDTVEASILEYYQDKIYYRGVNEDGNYRWSCLTLGAGPGSPLIEADGEIYFIAGETYFVGTELPEGKAGLYKMTGGTMKKLAGPKP